MLLSILIAITSISVGFHIGWYGKQMYIILRKIRNRKSPEKASIVNPLPPGYSDVNNTSSAIISPKSPAAIEFEERERIRLLEGQ